MKYLAFLLLTVISISSFTSCNKNKVSKVPLPEGYFEDTWDEPLAAAKDHERKIFVQFYAEWCSLCADFKQEVLNDDEVETYVNESFVAVLLDSENGVGKDVFEENNLSGHPLSAVFDKEGNLLAHHVGKMTKTEFLDWMKHMSNPFQPEIYNIIFGTP